MVGFSSFPLPVPATLIFYRSADSETQPEYFGVVTFGLPYAHHYQVEWREGGTPDWQRWSVQALSCDQFDALETTQFPYEPPYPIEQITFLQLLKTFALPPLPL